ncbi:hypothetical protein J6590_019701 [Homalodisca vitripennis]|nr:hypothetical protein J6590_019701 [Homalodisca vitripennis]
MLKALYSREHVTPQQYLYVLDEAPQVTSTLCAVAIDRKLTSGDHRSQYIDRGPLVLFVSLALENSSLVDASDHLRATFHLHHYNQCNELSMKPMFGMVETVSRVADGRDIQGA